MNFCNGWLGQAIDSIQHPGESAGVLEIPENLLGRPFIQLLSRHPRAVLSGSAARLPPENNTGITFKVREGGVQFFNHPLIKCIEDIRRAMVTVNAPVSRFISTRMKFFDRRL